jgi:hypothetical protein
MRYLFLILIALSGLYSCTSSRNAVADTQLLEVKQVQREHAPVQKQQEEIIFSSPDQREKLHGITAEAVSKERFSGHRAGQLKKLSNAVTQLAEKAKHLRYAPAVRKDDPDFIIPKKNYTGAKIASIAILVILVLPVLFIVPVYAAIGTIVGIIFFFIDEKKKPLAKQLKTYSGLGKTSVSLFLWGGIITGIAVLLFILALFSIGPNLSNPGSILLLLLLLYALIIAAAVGLSLLYIAAVLADMKWIYWLYFLSTQSGNTPPPILDEPRYKRP